LTATPWTSFLTGCPTCLMTTTISTQGLML
jgi:hypothetical protein